MTIKNTFVHLDLAAGAKRRTQRRCRSLPCSQRWAVQAKNSENQKADVILDTNKFEVLQTYDHFMCQEVKRQDALFVPSPLRSSSRLNSKAQAWTPGGPPPPQQPLAEGSRQIAAVVMTAASIISQAFHYAEVEASEGPAGWSIVLGIPVETIQDVRNHVLNFACKAILQAVGSPSASGIHVLGCKSTPFVMTHFGCSAMLGAVFDEKQACWDLLAQGFCHRGHACRWQHPMCRSAVNILVDCSNCA